MPDRASTVRCNWSRVNSAGIIEQFVALQDLLLVPRDAPDAEAEPRPVAPSVAQFSLRGRIGKQCQPRNDQRLDDRRLSFAPIFPRKITVPVAPLRVGPAAFLRPGERQITDRKHAR